MDPPAEPKSDEQKEKLEEKEVVHEKYHQDEPATEMLSQSSSDDEDGSGNAGTPQHPIPAMQGPFEESIADASLPEATKQPEKEKKLGAKARRQILLDTNQPNDTYNAKWRATDTATYHPLTKVMAQIAFGVHLLHQELAKSDEEVVRILQRHVDEVDSFLQRTDEDLDFAVADIKERISYLKLPLEHANVFDIMLEDKQFRTSILEGNDRIERVVNRTAHLMNDLHVDVSKAVEATIQMGRYLKNLESWPEGDSGSIEIYHTMQLNADGWEECLGALQLKANSLGVTLVQLGSILNEMAKRAGAASRRNLEPSRPSTGDGKHVSRMMSPPPLSKYSRKAMKPLPEDPDSAKVAVQSALSKRDQEFEQRYENPRPQPPTPTMATPARETQSSPRTRKSTHPSSKPSSGLPSPRKSTKYPTSERSSVTGRPYSSRPTTRPTTAKSSSSRPISSKPRHSKSNPPKSKSEKLKSEKLKPEKSKSEKPKPEKSKDKIKSSKSKPKKSPLGTELLLSPPPTATTPHKRSKTNESVFRTSFLRNALSSDPHENPPPMPDLPQSRLKRARSKLRRKQQPLTPGAEKKSSKQKRMRDAPPFSPDSAYSSGSNVSVRPMTSPSAVPKKPASFTLFPSTPSMLSLALTSPPMMHSNAGSQTSLPTALPPMPKQNGGSSLMKRRVSVPGSAGLKKRGSLIALRKLFRREKSTTNLRDMTHIYELPA